MPCCSCVSSRNLADFGAEGHDALGQEEIFKAALVKYGIAGLVDRVKEVSGEAQGLPGYFAWLVACLFGVPVKNYVRALTNPLSLCCLSKSRATAWKDGKQLL